MKRMNNDCVRLKIFNLQDLTDESIEHFRKYNRRLVILDDDRVGLPVDKWLRVRVKDFEVHELGSLQVKE